MRLTSIPFYAFLSLSALSAPKLEAQPSVPDSLISDSAYTAAIRQYHSVVFPEPGFYRGPQYVDYDFTIQQGQPFFGGDSLRPGSVWYSGILYQSRPILYDLVKDQLVIAAPSGNYKIALLMDFVDSFALDGQQFIRAGDSSGSSSLPKGYYDRIYKGRLELLKRDRKSLRENLMVTPDNVHLYIVEALDYYLKKDGRYYAVNTRRQLYDALADRKSEVRRLIRKSRLSWRNDKEQLLLAVAGLYDGPNHSLPL
ncbi:MAG TPA: hypothetical protein VGR89_16185 [Puia sp.]|nr:hypothetical protein [Puia sp.]